MTFESDAGGSEYVQCKCASFREGDVSGFRSFLGKMIVWRTW